MNEAMSNLWSMSFASGFRMTLREEYSGYISRRDTIFFLDYISFDAIIPRIYARISMSLLREPDL